MRSNVHRGLKWLQQRADAAFVIELHRLHGNGTFFVNADLIETLESRPDTTITLVNKHRYLVEDTVEQVIERITDFRARVAAAVRADADHAAGARGFAVTVQHEERAA